MSRVLFHFYFISHKCSAVMSAEFCHIVLQPLKECARRRAATHRVRVAFPSPLVTALLRKHPVFHSFRCLRAVHREAGTRAAGIRATGEREGGVEDDDGGGAEARGGAEREGGDCQIAARTGGVADILLGRGGSVDL